MLLFTVACSSNPAPVARQQDLVIVSWDTTRPDAIGASTPLWLEIAEQGLRFSNARSTAPLTLPAHASLLTGLYPQHHGARANGYFTLNPELPVLAERLQQAGWHTGAFVSAAVLDARFGLDRGFQVYDDDIPSERRDRYVPERPGEQTVDAALAWLSTVPPLEPLFLFVHLFEPHRPYATTYEAELQEADRVTRILLEGLGERREQAAVVLTSDHGEGFGEHGEATHGYFAYDSTIRVPLVVRLPGVQAAVRQEAVSLVDVAPTLLDFSGLEPIGDGVSLLESPEARSLSWESVSPAYEYGVAPSFVVLEPDGATWFDLPQRELYRDPSQQENLYGEDSKLQADAIFAQWPRAWPPEGAQSMGPEEIRELEALGYLAPAELADRPVDPKNRAAVATMTQTGGAGQLPSEALIRVQAWRREMGPIQAVVDLEVDLLDSLGRVEEADALLQATEAVDELEARQHRRSRDEALALAIGKALDADPEHASAHHDLALVLHRLGRHADAEQHYRAALAQDPDDHESRAGLIRLLVASGRVEEARVALDEGLTRGQEPQLRDQVQLLEELPVQ